MAKRLAPSVDPATMRVHGLDGIRVVDASAMPYVTNGNIYAPVMMMAEKASDLIRDVTPLQPISEPFYRHEHAGEEKGALPYPAVTQSQPSAAP